MAAVTREPITLKVNRAGLRDFIDEMEEHRYLPFGDELIAALDEAQAEAGDGRRPRTVEIVVTSLLGQPGGGS